MAFCSNCGEKLNDGAKFCTECGSSVARVIEHSTKRKQEYAGNIIKCPSCGEELSSLTAICPACGHEINQAKVSSSLKSFVDEINQCDRLIAAGPNPPKTGWSSWSMTARTWWVILNTFTACIPLVIYLALPLFQYGTPPSLSADEKKKVSLIENCTFPNDRESILEALLFIKAKTTFLASEKLNKKTAYWDSLWTAKAEQVYLKAVIVLKSDEVAQNSYNDIKNNRKKVEDKVKMKAILGGVILLMVIIFISMSLIKNDGSSLEINHNSTYKWPSIGLSECLPKPEINHGKIYSNSENIFIIDIYQTGKTQYNAFVNKCIDLGFNIDSERNDDSYYSYNKEGYKLVLNFNNYENEMHISIETPIIMSEISWPSTGISKLLPNLKSNIGNISTDSYDAFSIYIGSTSVDDFNAYIDACIKEGFDVNYSRGDKYFHANNKDGAHLDIKYAGFNTMFILINNES